MFIRENHERNNPTNKRIGANKIPANKNSKRSNFKISQKCTMEGALMKTLTLGGTGIVGFVMKSGKAGCVSRTCIGIV